LGRDEHFALVFHEGMTPMNDPNTNDLNVQARLESLEAREQQRAKRTRLLLAAGIACALATAFAVIALGAVPNVFASGSPIVAADLNANFAHVVAGVTAVEARAAAIEARRAGPLYCGAGAATTGAIRSGAANGYPAARDVCRTVCGGSATAHMCTTNEVAISLQMGVRPTVPGGWVNGGTWHDESTVVINVADCIGWTHNTNPQQQGSHFTVTTSTGYPDSLPCTASALVLCCD